MLDFFALWDGGGIGLGGGLGVSGFGEELGRFVCRRGGEEGERRARVCGWVNGLESSWKCALLHQTRQ